MSSFAFVITFTAKGVDVYEDGDGEWEVDEICKEEGFETHALARSAGEMRLEREEDKYNTSLITCPAYSYDASSAYFTMTVSETRRK